MAGASDVLCAAAVSAGLGGYQRVRDLTLRLTEPLPAEDMVLQSMPQASPAKWHLAHTSWFFERFLLERFVPGYEPIDGRYYYLFNSYYNGAGPQHCRASRGLASRPTVEQVLAYRRAIDERMGELIERRAGGDPEGFDFLLALGLHHEQQHQELLLSDLKHAYSSNPLLPAYGHAPDAADDSGGEVEPVRWIAFEEGLREIGHEGAGFCYDNERPRHRVYLYPFAIAHRPVVNAEVAGFIEAGGYSRPELWLSDGFAAAQAGGWVRPIYWYREGGRWMHYTLGGPGPVAMDEPASHLSYYEADAIARWLGARLPSEAEWELAAGRCTVEAGHFMEAWRFHPQGLSFSGGDEAADPRGMFGQVWEWTRSPYVAYPGYRPWAGTVGEYNGKFMCDQWVLRGGSCLSPADHLRRTYRNFFPAGARWQLSGVRLARDT